MLLEDDQGKPRFKMYYDDKTGMFRGEALVVYFKPESVELAINMLDETNMRAAIGQTSSSGPICECSAPSSHRIGIGDKVQTARNCIHQKHIERAAGSDIAEAGKGAECGAAT